MTSNDDGIQKPTTNNVVEVDCNKVDAVAYCQGLYSFRDVQTGFSEAEFLSQPVLPPSVVEEDNGRSWKYSEKRILDELYNYIVGTYGEHYGGGKNGEKLQALELIIEEGHGVGFLVGQLIKYSCRYGKKDKRNRKDLMKILHYAVVLLHVHDLENDKDE